MTTNTDNKRDRITHANLIERELIDQVEAAIAYHSGRHTHSVTRIFRATLRHHRNPNARSIVISRWLTAYS